MENNGVQEVRKEQFYIVFPGGEIHIPERINLEHLESPIGLLRGGSAEDLIALCLWGNLVSRVGGRPVALVPYLPGARADHFPREEGDFYANLLNLGNFVKVVVLDPHSGKVPASVHNIKVITAVEVMARFLPQVYFEQFDGVIAPDAGALLRAGQVADYFKLPLYEAHKERDKVTGQIVKYKISDLPSKGEFLVVDDICDGGGTFKLLAQGVPDAKKRLSLWVTHGIFSGNAAELTNFYKNITTTDSHPGALRGGFGEVVEILPLLLEALAA